MKKNPHMYHDTEAVYESFYLLTILAADYSQSISLSIIIR